MPVNYVELGLYEYPTIIKKPMDLGTCRANLKAGKYKTVEECLADLQLIWDNCKLFNHESSVDLYSPENPQISHQAG